MKLTDEAQDYQAIKKKLNSKTWRLNNLYKIKDKTGKVIPFKMNWAQNELYKNIWYFNIILKARQLGFTTFIMIYFLDACLFNSNHSVGVIAHTKDDAEDLFSNKAKFAYDNLPDWLRRERPATQDSAKKLSFTNGSSFNVGTSLRSGTYQKLLVSEYGKVSAKYPEKAREIKTGALNTVEVGQQIFVESTAEGKSGEFFDLCEQARKLADLDKELTRTDPRFHFFPWQANPEYSLPEHEVALTPITPELDQYLTELGVDDGQKAWYAAKHTIMGEDMKREYPSTPAEAFEGSLQGAYYLKEMAELRKGDRIRRLQRDQSHPVFTFWDLGLNDSMAIIFAQYINGTFYALEYHESSGNGWEYYGQLMQDKGYIYDHHFMPHDANTRVMGTQIATAQQLAEQMGIRPVKIVSRTTSIAADIRNYCRPFFAQCVFDELGCAALITHLDNYRKKWDRVAGMYVDEPVHDDSSHGCDAFRTAAVAIKTGMITAYGDMDGEIKNKTAVLKTSQRFARRRRI